MPKSNFNGIRAQSEWTDPNSPRQLPKNISHAKSSSLDQESNRNKLSSIDVQEQQTALVLPHLMLSRSTYLPKTTSLPLSSIVSCPQPNSFRSSNIVKNNSETVDIYEDPSEHYSIIGRPLTITSFQTSTPVRNTVSASHRGNMENKEGYGLMVNSAQSSSVLGSKHASAKNHESSSFRLGYGKHNIIL